MNGHRNIRRKSNPIVGNTTRSMAFRIVSVILIGTAVGSVLPETGNLAVLYITKGTDAHVFNIVFLIIGIIGIVLALFIGYRKCK